MPACAARVMRRSTSQPSRGVDDAVLPGFALRSVVRDMLRYHSGDGPPRARIDAARAKAAEAFAGGCLTTTFVWMQHLGTTPACAFGPGEVEGSGACSERWSRGVSA